MGVVVGEFQALVDEMLSGWEFKPIGEPIALPFLVANDEKNVGGVHLSNVPCSLVDSPRSVRSQPNLRPVDLGTMWRRRPNGAHTSWWQRRGLRAGCELG